MNDIISVVLRVDSLGLFVVFVVSLFIKVSDIGGEVKIRLVEIKKESLDEESLVCP